MLVLGRGWSWKSEVGGLKSEGKRLKTQNSRLKTQKGVACGPCCTLILREALATWPVYAAITNAAGAVAEPGFVGLKDCHDYSFRLGYKDIRNGAEKLAHSKIKQFLICFN